MRRRSSRRCLLLPTRGCGSRRSSSAAGLLDPQIFAHRILGEMAMASGNLPAAVERYRRSLAILDTVSQRIPSDIAKVGYRGERNRALPLLVQALYDIHTRAPSPASL